MQEAVDHGRSVRTRTAAKWRKRYCWCFAVAAIIFGMIAMASPQNWLNDRVAGLCQIFGGLVLLPPVLGKLRGHFAFARPILAPVVFGVLLVPISFMLAVPFKPSQSEQLLLQQAAMSRANALLAQGKPGEARMALRKFTDQRQHDAALDNLLARIDNTLSPVRPSSEPASLASSSAMPAKEIMQPPAAAYAERIQTYWLPEARALPETSPAGDEAFGKLLSQIDGLVFNIEDGTNLELSASQKGIRSQLVKTLSKKQVALLPAMRRRYAQALDAKLFRHDVRVSVSGRTLRVIGRMFVRNANVEDMQMELAPVANRLRFRAVEYRWDEQMGQSIRYDLSSPSDAVVSRWNGTEFVATPH